jgi:hypothetical protein
VALRIRFTMPVTAAKRLKGADHGNEYIPAGVCPARAIPAPAQL